MITKLANITDILNVLVFILLCFLGVFGRISYEVEVKGKKYTLKSFFNRFFITIVLCYVMELFILGNQYLKNYYTQAIIIIAFFSVDVIRFFADNFYTFIIYVLNVFFKGIGDLVKNISNKQKHKNEE